MKKRIIAVVLSVLFVFTLLPITAFADGEETKTLNVRYPSAGRQYSAGGKYTVNGEETQISDSFFQITPGTNDIVFNLTPPQQNYPVTEGITPVVYLNNTDISQRVNENSFTITQGDFGESPQPSLSIYWCQQEKDYETLFTTEQGKLYIGTYFSGVGYTISEPCSQAIFGNNGKAYATPDTDGKVVMTLNDTPTGLTVSIGTTQYNLMQTPVAKSGDDTMIEYSSESKTITFYTKVSALSQCLTDNQGIVQQPLSVTIQKSSSPTPTPTPSSPEAQIQQPINEKCAYIVIDEQEPGKSYIKYDMPTDYLYFQNIPAGSGNKINGYYDELIEQGYKIEYTWPEQSSYETRLKVGDTVNSTITISKEGVFKGCSLQVSKEVSYDSMNVTKFEIAETITLTENVDGTIVTTQEGKYFEYSYTDKVKFNVEYSCLGKEGTQTYKQEGITMAEAKKLPGLGQRTFLVEDTQEKTHWEGGKTYTAYFAMAGVIATATVKIEKSDKPIDYWEKQADAAVSEIAPDNAITVKSIVPENAEDSEVIFENIFSEPNDKKYKDKSLSFELVASSEDFKTATINVYRTSATADPQFIKAFKNINVSYVYDQGLAEEVSGYEEEFRSFDYNDQSAQYYGNVYLVQDLDMLNLTLNGGKSKLTDLTKIIDFSSDFLKDVERSNLETILYVTDNQTWEGQPPATKYACGKLLLIYDDTVYGVADNVGFILVNVIYIPTDTEKTEEAFIAAAMDRIKAFTNSDGSKYVIKADSGYTKPSGLLQTQVQSRIMTLKNNLLKNVFSLQDGESDMTLHTVDTAFTFGIVEELSLPVYIVADSDKMQKQTDSYMQSTDLSSKAAVSTDSDAYIPLDTKISATKHTDDAVYNEQISKIGISEGVVFDIELNSYIRDGKITKTDAGEGFNVKIPVPDTYAEKTLKAYYTPDTGAIEEHDATVVKEGDKYFATFKTNHFSTYTIGEEKAELKTPEAADFTFTAPASLTYDGTAKTATVTGKEGMGTITVKYYDKDGEVLTSAPVDAGTYTVKIDVAEGTAYKTGNDLTAAGWTFTITQAAVTVTAKDASKVYGTDDPEFTATVEGTIGTDKVEYTVTRVAGKDVGTYAITPKGAASQGNYTVTYKEGTFTITQAPVTVTAKDASKVYGTDDPEFTAEVKGTIGTDKVEYTVTRAAGKDVGTYAITPKGAASQGNYTVTYKEGTFTITQAPVTVTAKDASKEYGAKDPALTAEVKGTLGTDTVKYTVSRTKGEDAGAYTITPAGDASQGNYAVTYVSGTFTINPAKDTPVKTDTDALAKIQKEYQEKNPGKEVAVEMLVSEKADASDVAKIQAKAGTKKLVSFDASLAVTVDGKAVEDAGSTNSTLVSTTYKFDFTNKSEIQAFRVHGGSVDELTTNPNADGEYIKLDKEAGTIMVVASKYSTYAFAYKETAVPATGDSGNAWLYIIIAVLALGATAGASLAMRRRANR